MHEFYWSLLLYSVDISLIHLPHIGLETNRSHVEVVFLESIPYGELSNLGCFSSTVLKRHYPPRKGTH